VGVAVGTSSGHVLVVSSQLVPGGHGDPDDLQLPLASSQVSVPLQNRPSSQFRGGPVHVPDWHVSGFVQKMPSLQAEPFGLIGFEHCPVVGSHTPISWHWSSGVHGAGFEPVQNPF
jgi:hypothetical protein